MDEVLLFGKSATETLLFQILSVHYNYLEVLYFSTKMASPSFSVLSKPLANFAYANGRVIFKWHPRFPHSLEHMA